MFNNPNAHVVPTRTLETILSSVLVLSAAAIAVVVVRREFVQYATDSMIVKFHLSQNCPQILNTKGGQVFPYAR